jgi:hypothetical protein
MPAHESKTRSERTGYGPPLTAKLFPSVAHHRRFPSCGGEPILPRSRHLPLASTDGSRSENLNEIGVRMLLHRDATKTLRFVVDLPAINSDLVGDGEPERLRGVSMHQGQSAIHRPLA